MVLCRECSQNMCSKATPHGGDCICYVEFMCSDGRHGHIVSCCDHSLEAYNKELRNQLEINQTLKEEIGFLGKWSFVPGEPSSSSDVMLYTRDGSNFFAHTLILANRSDVFRAMFGADMKGKRCGNVLIENVGGKTLGVFLKFLYTAQVRQEDMETNYKELVKLAHLYQVKLLLLKMDKFIAKCVLTKEKVTELLIMAHMYELEITKGGAHKIFADDCELVKQMEGHPWMSFHFSRYLVNRLNKAT